MAIDPRDRVIQERQRRGQSARAAAAAAGTDGNGKPIISNTLWSRYEAGAVEVTSTVRLGVARSYGWQTDWPEYPPVGPVTELDALQNKVDRLTDLVTRVLEAIEGSDTEPPV